MKTEFQRWALGYSGCDGGDIGEPVRRTTWVCGIEWGGGHTADELTQEMESAVDTPPSGYASWEHNLEYIFNWQTIKLLTVIAGGEVKDYKMFAQELKPFVSGSNGYFKMNLFPVAFKDTNPQRWMAEFADLTGFTSKDEYLTWCRINRLSNIRKWVTTHCPQLVICLGKTYIEDFLKSFLDEESILIRETIDGRDINWARNREGTLVVVLPFMVNRNGLVKNDSIQKVGKRIAELI